MPQDRDTRQPTPAEYVTSSGTNPQPSTTPDSQLLINRGAAIFEVNKPITRESLIEEHGLDPNDPGAAAVLAKILDLRDNARLTSFLPHRASKYIADFKLSQQGRNGTTPIEEPE